MHPLESCRLKLNRASEHLHAIERDIAAFHRSSPYGIVGKFYPKSSTYRFRIRVFEHPPRELGLGIGDFVHNVSSALEQLVWQLAILNGKKPVPGRTGFPAFESRAKYRSTKGGAWMLQGVHPLHQAEIESLQPYHAGDKAPWQPLAMLRRLWNIDKHRVIHTTIGIPEAIGASEFTPLRDCGLTERFKIFLRPFEDNAPVAWVKIVPTGPNPKVDVDLYYSIEVAFRQPTGMFGPSIDGHSVIKTLTEIRREAERIYSRLLLDF